ILGNIAAGPTNKCRLEELDLFEDIVAHTSGSRITWQQRNLINPDCTFTRKKNRKTRQWIIHRWFQGKSILVPVTLTVHIKIGRVIDLTERYVRLERDSHTAGVILRLEPDVALIFNTSAHRNTRLIYTVTVNDTVASFDAQ